MTRRAEKRYNAWGGVIASANTGSHKLIPNKAYCANLGHTVDGESGLIYMRARYYEPWTGRFISEDPARDGLNWFAYADNNPVGKSDPSGCHEAWEVEQFFGNVMMQLGRFLMSGVPRDSEGVIQKVADQLADYIGKHNGEGVRDCYIYAKLAQQMLSIYRSFSKGELSANAGSRWAGFDLCLQGIPTL